MSYSLELIATSNSDVLLNQASSAIARNSSDTSVFLVNQSSIIFENKNGKYYKTMNDVKLWGVVAHWYSRDISAGGSWVRIPLYPPCRDRGQVLHSIAFRRVNTETVTIVVVGSASERLVL